MGKPKVGDLVKLIPDPNELIHIDEGRVLAVFDTLEEWWPDHGECKMGLMEYLDERSDSPTAEWYAVVENLDLRGETMAIASFECQLIWERKATLPRLLDNE